MEDIEGRELGSLVDLSVSGMVSAATLALATPNLVIAGLALFGCSWTPVPLPDVPVRNNDAGLYAWVIARTDDPDADLHAAPAIYWGKGGSAEGVTDRLRNELAWSRQNPIVGHGLAVARTKAVPVVGPLTLIDSAQDRWEQLIPSIPEHVAEAAIGRLSDFSARLHTADQTLDFAERFAIRAALCAGDVGAPVNSQFGSAWTFTEGGPTDLADVAAWYAVRYLAGGVRGWTN